MYVYINLIYVAVCITCTYVAHVCKKFEWLYVYVCIYVIYMPVYA